MESGSVRCHAESPIAALQQLLDKHGQLPHTPTALTGGGRQHIWLRAPAGVKLQNSASKLGPGLDIKTDGGYAVVPPSWHISRNYYEWEASSLINDTPIADAPHWLIDLISQSNHGNRDGFRAPITQFMKAKGEMFICFVSVARKKLVTTTRR